MSNNNPRVAIVTGAGRGIGRAVALRLSRAGFTVALASRTVSELDETRRLIEAGGGRAASLPADAADAEQIARLVEQAETLGRIEALVNNAGYVAVGAVDQLAIDEFDRIMAVNVRSVFLGCRAVWPRLIHGGGGVIVNIASMSACDPYPGLELYGAAKAAVVALTRSLAAAGGSSGIRLFGVAPGAVETRMLRGHFPDVPASQTLDPDEVAALVERMILSKNEDPYRSGDTVWLRREHGICHEGVMALG